MAKGKLEAREADAKRILSLLGIEQGGSGRTFTHRSTGDLYVASSVGFPFGEASPLVSFNPLRKPEVRWHLPFRDFQRDFVPTLGV